MGRTGLVWTCDSALFGQRLDSIGNALPAGPVVEP